LQTSQVRLHPGIEANTQTKTQLENVCHNCGYAKNCDTFFETAGAQKEIDTTNLIHDLTFLRTRAIPCPMGCNGEVLYLKKKAQEQHLLFVCCSCSEQFKHTTSAGEAAAEDEAEDDDEAEAEAEGDEDVEDEGGSPMNQDDDNADENY
jgi:hypothetical protein